MNSSNLPDNSSENVKTFTVLLTLSNIFHVLGWIIIVIGAVTAIMIFDFRPYFGILTGLGIAFVGLFSIAFGELIKLFLQIEINTRKRH